MYKLISETVKDDPKAELEFSKEFNLYFESLKANDPKRYKQVSDIKISFDFEPESTAFIAIPCYIKEQNLRRTLSFYTQQRYKNFEIIICLNAGKSISEEEFNLEAGKKRAEIQALKLEYPDLKVHVFEQYFSQEEPVIGNIRKLLSETICIVVQKAGIKDPIIINNDSDCVSMKPNYVGSYVKKFQNKKNLDYVAGIVEWDADVNNPYALAKQAPELLIGQRIVQIIAAIKRHRLHSYSSGRRVESWGQNLAYRASAYLASGGFDSSSVVAEERILQSRMSFMRCLGDDNFYPYQDLNLSSSLQTSARRYLETIINGGTFLDQWEKFEEKFGANLDEKDLIELYQKHADLLQYQDIKSASEGDAEARLKLKKRVEHILERTLVSLQIQDGFVIVELLKRLGIHLTNRYSKRPLKQWQFKFQELELTNIDGISIDLEASRIGLQYIYRYYGLGNNN